MILNIFHVSVSHSYVFFGEMSVHVFCPFFNQNIWFLLLSFIRSLDILDTSPLLDMSFAGIFSHSIGSFSFYCFLHCAEAFYFDVVPIVYFWFYFLASGDISRKMLLWLMSEKLLSVLSSKLFMVSGLMLRSLIHEFTFVFGVRKWSSFILLHAAVQFSQHHLLKRPSFSIGYSFLLWSKVNWPYSQGFISGFSILFYWSRCLFLCQYYTVLITTALYYNLKSGVVIPQVLFFFFKIVLAI